ncbi:poly(A)-specific ribonuclease [Sarracenia purpurea var. burkii]
MVKVLFRWKKKKEYERMTAEEKILYKLRKARKKEERLIEAQKKIEPTETSEAIHDPEILTPEEHFYFLKMVIKCKNYVPVERRGIYQGVILNMHLHRKKHQTLKVVVKTFSPEEVKEIAAELARLSGGIVLDIQKEEQTLATYMDSANSGSISNLKLEKSDNLRVLMAENDDCHEYGTATESGIDLDSEDLSDIFETDCD